MAVFFLWRFQMIINDKKRYIFGSAQAEYVRTCLFIYDLLSFIYCLVSPYKHIYLHTWKIEEDDL